MSKLQYNYSTSFIFIIMIFDHGFWIMCNQIDDVLVGDFLQIFHLVFIGMRGAFLFVYFNRDQRSGLMIRT